MSHRSDWRQSTHDEIGRYYESEFPSQIPTLPQWISPNAPKQYALSFRQGHPVQITNAPEKNFIRRDTRESNNPDKTFIDTWSDVVDFVQQPATYDPLRLGTNDRRGLIPPTENNGPEVKPEPEAVYYALDNWEQFWVLAFDIDAKDVAKERISSESTSYQDVSDETVEDAGIIQQPPTPDTISPIDATGFPDGQGSMTTYPYLFSDIETSLEYAFKLREWLLDTVGFETVRVFYSGQGAHIYAFKDDPYYKLTHQSRRFLVTYVREQLKIPIDEAVTWDNNRVMRLPGSLHTGVNRVVTEIQSPEFDFRTDALPPAENTTTRQ